MIQITAKTNNKMIDGIIIISFRIEIIKSNKNYNIKDFNFLLNNEDNYFLKEIMKIKNNKDYFSLEKDNLIGLLYKTIKKEIVYLDNNNLVLKTLELNYEFQDEDDYQNYFIKNLITKKSKIKINKEIIDEKLAITYIK